MTGNIFGGGGSDWGADEGSERPMEREGPPQERRRLQLKPRSAAGAAQASKNSPRSSKSNPFGAAKPREEVLRAKGVDVAAKEAELDKRVSKLPRMNKDQQETLDSLRSEVDFAKNELTKASTAEDKSKAQTELDKKNAEMEALIDSLKKADLGGGDKPTFQRVSERRAAREEGGGGGGYGGGDGGQGGGFDNFGGGGRRGGGGGNRESNDAKLFVGNLSFQCSQVRLALCIPQPHCTKASSSVAHCVLLRFFI